METKKEKIGVLYVLVGMLVAATVFAAPNHVVISEVLYNPINTESGGEAVELFNPTSQEVNISGYILKTESSAVDATVPLGTVLESGSFYLIADAGWAVSKDNSSWPNADHEEAISLTNTDAGVALVANGSIVDAVGWGASGGIMAGLFEGIPMANGIEGLSIQRVNLFEDTEKNSADFLEAVPSFENATFFLSSEKQANVSVDGKIAMSVAITNERPVLGSIFVEDDDDIKSGIQVSPLPGEKREVKIEVMVSDSERNVREVVGRVSGPVSFEKTVVFIPDEEINATTTKYSVNFSLDYFLNPGTYTIEMNVTDEGNLVDVKNVSFEYLAMAALTVDANSLVFENATVGKSAKILGDLDVTTKSAPSLKNAGNVAIDIGVYGTNLTDGAKLIAIENVKYSLDNDFESDISGVMNANLKVVGVNVTVGENEEMPLGFELFIPSETENGNYLGEVHVVAVNH